MNKSVVLDSGNFKLEMSAEIYKNDPAVNNVILHVMVCSDGFVGTMDMDVGINNLNQFVKQIHSMNEVIKGSATLKETYGESYIGMEMDKTGHIIVSGYLNTLNHKLDFKNKFELHYLDSFDKALSDTDNWQYFK